MAEKTENTSKTSEKSGDELNSLLKSALDDFDSYSPPAESTATPSKEVTKTETSKSDEKLQEDFENKFQKFLLSDLDETAFSSQMSNLLSEVQTEIQSYVGDPNSASADENTETVSQAINALMQNMEQIKDNMKNESPDNLRMGDTFMEQMMQMLMSKEVLYPSLLSVKEKYPSWLEENRSKIDSVELNRFTEQYNVIERICVMFESENDSDSEEVKQKRFVELVGLLQKMTDLGQPPQDLAESLPTGMENELFGSQMDPNSCNPM